MLMTNASAFVLLITIYNQHNVFLFIFGKCDSTQDLFMPKLDNSTVHVFFMTKTLV